MSSSPHAVADRIWQRFGEMFGARFFESFGPKPSESWKEAVKDLRHDQVRGALGKILGSGSAHPPSLPEFIALAKNIQTMPQHQPAAAPVHPLQGAANSALLTLLRTRGPTTEACIHKLVALKNQIVAGLPDDSDPTEVRDVLLQAFERIWEPETEADREAALRRFRTGPEQRCDTRRQA